jgi:hypothetical protein
MRIIVMFISFPLSRSGRFKSWSDARPSASNDDDHSIAAAAAALFCTSSLHAAFR